MCWSIAHGRLHMKKLDSKKTKTVIAISLGLAMAVLVLAYMGLFNAKDFFGSLSSRLTGKSRTAEMQKSDSSKSDATNSKSTNAQGSSSIESNEANSLDPQAREQVAQIENFVQTEAKSLDLTRVQSREKEIKLQAVARQLSPPQIERLTEVIADTNRGVNERILGVFLLNLNSSNSAIENLNNFAAAALPDFGPVLPHSESEIRRNQELSLRFMVIDRLAEVARNSEPQSEQRLQAVGALKDHARQNPSETLRKYAQTTLDELGE